MTLLSLSSSSLSSLLCFGSVLWSSYLVGTTNAYRCSRCDSGSGTPSFPQWTCDLEDQDEDYWRVRQEELDPDLDPGTITDYYSCSRYFDDDLCLGDQYRVSYFQECGCPDEVRVAAGGPDTDNCYLSGLTCNCKNIEDDYSDYHVCPFERKGEAYLCTDVLYVCWNIIPPEVLGLIDDYSDNTCNMESVIQEVVYCDDSSRNSLKGGLGPIDAPGCGDFCTSHDVTSCPNGKEETHSYTFWSPANEGRLNSNAPGGDLIDGFCDYTEHVEPDLGSCVHDCDSCDCYYSSIYNDYTIPGDNCDTSDYFYYDDVGCITWVTGWSLYRSGGPIKDVEAPTIVCPSSFTVKLADSPLEWEVEYELPTVSDNCSPNALTPQLVSGPAVGDTIGPSTYKIIYKAVDEADNEATCSFDIVVDGPPNPPTIECPGNIEIESCVETTIEFGGPTFDGIELSLTTQPSGLVSGSSVFPVRSMTTITHTVTDRYGRKATCSFDLVVSDPPQLPSITCPGNIEVETCVDPSVEFDDPVYDGIDAILTPDPSGLVSGSVFPVRSTTSITFTATDACGREATCSFDVVISDPPQLPSITCPDNIEMEEVCVDTAVEFDDPVYDGIDAILTPDPSGLVSGSVFSVGTTTPITFTATDACNREASCTLLVTLLRDTQDPTVTCSMTRECGGGGGCHFRAEWTAADNCGAEALATTGYVTSLCFPEDIPIVSSGQIIDYFPIVKDSVTVDWNKGGCPAQGTKNATLFLEVMDGAGNTAGCEAVVGFSNRNKVRGLRSLQK